jgi:hypothetical protein
MDPNQPIGLTEELATLAREVRDHGGSHSQLFRLSELVLKHLESCEADLAQMRLDLARAERALLTSRDIGIAMGILMTRRGIDRDSAFGVLRRSSQDSQVKIRDLAVEFLRSGRLTGSESGKAEAMRRA